MSEELETLQRNRDLILLTEIVGWLHDIDKLDENHEKGHPIRSLELNLPLIENEKRPKKLESLGALPDIPSKVAHFLRSPFPHADSYPELFYSIKRDYITRIGSPILRHHKRGGYTPVTRFEWIICGSDSKDSSEDRDNLEREPSSAYLSTPFGYSYEVPKADLRERRLEFYQKLEKSVEKVELLRRDLRSYLPDELRITFAESRLAGNDITLYDHCYMTGVIAKAVINGYLLNSTTRSNIQASADLDDTIKNKLKFQGLLVTFNGISFLTNVYRLSDLIGREYILTEIKKAIKELLETEIPIGSTIYEDTNTLTFLVPELDNDTWEKLRVELENKLRERIFSVLRGNLELSDLELANLIILLNPFFLILSPEKEVAKLMVESIQSSREITAAKEFSEITMTFLQLLSKAWKIKRDKCQVCGLLPATEEDRGDKICKSCYILRSWGRFKTKEENMELVKKGRIPVSIWLDEIKDENDLLALVVGKVSPVEEWLKPNGYVQNSTYINKNKKKNLSASRARAIWRTIDKFCESCTILPENVVEEAYGCIWEFDEFAIQNLPAEIKSELGRNPNIDIIFDKNRIQAYLHYSTKKIETIVGLNRELAEKLSEISELNIEYRKSRFKIEVSRAEVKHFCKYRPIYSHAGEFALLVPANKAFEICRRIKAKFGEEFGKVLGRLTLSLGIIYFKHKMPLYIVLESGRRMLDNFYKLSNERRELSVKNVKEISTGYKLMMLYMDKELNWIIYSKFPDGKDDIYYPYFFISGEEEPKHVSEISENDVLKVHLNYFDYEYITSSQNRFKILLNGETEKRWHPIFGRGGPKPYLLEDIEKMVELWNILNKGLTRTQIKKLEYVCVNKIKEWGLEGKDLAEDSRFKEFVVSSVENICRRLNKDDKRVIISSILSGMFFDVIELFMTLESKIGGEQNG